MEKKKGNGKEEGKKEKKEREKKSKKKYNHDGYKKETREFLDHYGHYPITALKVIVMPLPFLLPIILNLLTRREFNKYMKARGYERFYHWELMATIKIDDEDKEKEVIIQKSGGDDIDINFENKSYTYFYKSLIGNKKVIDVPFTSLYEKKELTISSILNKTRNKLNYEDYYEWNIIGKKNCQGYVKAILESIDLYDETILGIYNQSTIGDLETEFMEKHAFSLFIVNILSYMLIYFYSFINFMMKCIHHTLLPRFSRYMNI